ncbi:MAG: ABC transporter ATP-binding protein [Clostridia bacterium]|nr:ABC transporter ATP-binding protein [Clostridia bacterium]
MGYRYPKAKDETLKDVSFHVEEGEIFGLLGRSGAGKSTTQKLLIRLLTGFRGEVLYKGKDLISYNNSFYEDVGVGFEMPVHFTKLTARENLLYFSKLYKNNADIDELLTKVDLYDYRNQIVGEFSKGMKVRLNFIRALINKPRVLFLDEVTNGLDPGNAKTIKNIIADFKKQGGTVFLTTHLMNDVEELCDRVAFISQGNIAEIATPRELKLKYGQKNIKIEYRKDGEIMDSTFELQGIGTNAEFLELIRNNDIETAHSGETKLEDIFIKLVEDK